MPIAELNIGRIRWEIDDPRMAGFADNLERINALAERSPGFVWRLQGDTGDATGFHLSDSRHIPNLSVWESVEALQAYVFKTVHARFFERREEWFEPYDGPYFVMWPVPDGHEPTLEEAMTRLEKLRAEGPSAEAFDWKTRAQFAPDPQGETA